MTRRETYSMMQRVNRDDYEMGWTDRGTYQRTELALAVDWDESADRRVALARQIRDERQAERRLRDATLIVECRHCRSYLDIPALSFDAEQGHVCASCARQAVMA